MKTFHCNGCQSLIFYENTLCLTCHRALAYFADTGEMLTLEPSDKGTWISVRGNASDADRFKLCTNYSDHGACNWVTRG